MPTYVMLSTLTPEGVQTVKNNPQRIRETTMARVSLELGSRGTSKYETLVAIPIDDFIATL
jgi:uncharacterized protein with GYD domain